MKTGYTHITMVLDRSGSMGNVKTDTIHGVNEFWRKQAGAPGEYTATLTLFNTVVETRLKRASVADNRPVLDELNYVPEGFTALYDAVGDAVDDTGRWINGLDEMQRPAKVIVVIVTDGMENASRRHTQKEVFERITHQRDIYKWEFVFIGANIDAYEVGASLGVSPKATINYTQNSAGTHAIYACLSDNVLRSRCCADGTSDWTAADFAAQEKAKAK